MVLENSWLIVVLQVAEIAAEMDLEVGAWQDGVVHNYEPPFPRQRFTNKNVAVYAWKNVWETGMASDVNKLANTDYQVWHGCKRVFLPARLGRQDYNSSWWNNGLIA